MLPERLEDGESAEFDWTSQAESGVSDLTLFVAEEDNEVDSWEEAEGDLTFPEGILLILPSR